MACPEDVSQGQSLVLSMGVWGAKNGGLQCVFNGNSSREKFSMEESWQT